MNTKINKQHNKNNTIKVYQQKHNGQPCIRVSHKDEQNALKSLKKEVIVSWKSLENHSQVSVGTLGLTAGNTSATRRVKETAV